MDTYASIADCAKKIKHDPIYLATKLSQGIKRGQNEIKVNGVWLRRIKKVVVESKRPDYEVTMGRVPDPKPLGPTPEALDRNYQEEVEKNNPQRKRSDGTDVQHRFGATTPSPALALPGTFFCQCCSHARSNKDEARVCVSCVTSLKQIQAAVIMIGKAVLGGKL